MAQTRILVAHPDHPGWQFDHESSIDPSGEYTNCPECSESGEHAWECPTRTALS